MDIFGFSLRRNHKAKDCNEMSSLPAPCPFFPWLYPVQLFRPTLSAKHDLCSEGSCSSQIRGWATRHWSVIKPCKCSFHSIHQHPSVPLFGLQPHRALHASPYRNSPHVPASIKQVSTKATLPQVFPNTQITQSGQVLQRVPLLQPQPVL